jgi:hypothetical protein
MMLHSDAVNCVPHARLERRSDNRYEVVVMALGKSGAPQPPR